MRRHSAFHEFHVSDSLCVLDIIEEIDLQVIETNVPTTTLFRYVQKKREQRRSMLWGEIDFPTVCNNEPMAFRVNQSAIDHEVYRRIALGCSELAG